MSTAKFKYLEKNEFSAYAPMLFSILHTNMSVIAPSGNSYDEGYTNWCNTFGKAFIEREQRKLILIKSEATIIGFFGYSCNESTFKMEEIQLASEYHGVDGIFRQLYHFVVENLPAGLKYVEAYADKRNGKSISILNRLGLKIVGEDEGYYHFEGSFAELLLWLNSLHVQ